MRRRILGMLLGGVLAGFGSATAAARPWRLAVHPYGSTLALINTHRPLVNYLAASLVQPIEFYTAASFDAYVDALLAGEYDIAVAPPHFAVLAMAERYWPVLHYQTQLEPLLVVRNDSPVQQAIDLRGKRVAMADRTALIRLASMKWLADRGLQSGRDYQIVERPNHGASIGAALAGEAEAGLATSTVLRQLPDNVQALVRPISMGLRFPHLFTLINRKHGEGMRRRLQAALLAFAKTLEGRSFLADSGYGGYEEISSDEIRLVRPYAEMYQREYLRGGQ